MNQIEQCSSFERSMVFNSSLFSPQTSLFPNTQQNTPALSRDIKRFVGSVEGSLDKMTDMYPHRTKFMEGYLQKM